MHVGAMARLRETTLCRAVSLKPFHPGRLTMQWKKGKLNIDLEVLAPQDKVLADRYLVGTRMLLLMKSALAGSRDPDYLEFLDLYERLTDATLLDFDRAYTLFQFSRATAPLNGCSAECGVYRGGGSVLIAGGAPSRRHYAMDTFEGFPDVLSDVDRHEETGFSDATYSEVSRLFQDYANIIALKGPFSETLPSIAHQAFSFVHVDADLYVSTQECLKFFYERMLPGGVMLFDDYLVPDTPGVKKAVDEFFLSRSASPIILPTFQAMVVKI